jgi:transketolase
MEARKYLLEEGIDVGLYSVPFISSLKHESLSDVLSLGPVLTVEEHSIRGGLGGSILELISVNGLRGLVRILGASQKDLSQIGDQAFLREENGIGIASIVKAFKSLLAG